MSVEERLDNLEKRMTDIEKRLQCQSKEITADDIAQKLKESLLGPASTK